VLSERERRFGYDVAYLGQFLFVELHIVECGEIVLQLVERSCSQYDRSHPLVGQHPCQSHLRHALSALLGYLAQLACRLNTFGCHLACLQKTLVARRAAALRDSVVVLACQQSLRQRRETDDSAAVVCRYLEIVFFAFKSNMEQRYWLIRQGTLAAFSMS